MKRSVNKVNYNTGLKEWFGKRFKEFSLYMESSMELRLESL